MAKKNAVVTTHPYAYVIPLTEPAPQQVVTEIFQLKVVRNNYVYTTDTKHPELSKFEVPTTKP